ncbi:hypothetical protein [Caulobacter sp. 17J80-11]|uniref:hypothetical protein n=1 Tax=Caulobacter sp. 17J80-11 TaxID=2763502 RepID=UPI001653EBBB|nr:hypothetical protein [Caulobacter sp. 17J80-11]MBC6981378.1 hypothetical protein [Caulobacter sp. 17J80-11]
MILRTNQQWSADEGSEKSNQKIDRSISQYHANSTRSVVGVSRGCPNCLDGIGLDVRSPPKADISSAAVGAGAVVEKGADAAARAIRSVQTTRKPLARTPKAKA